MTAINPLISKETLEEELLSWASRRGFAHFYLNQKKQSWSHIGYNESVSSFARSVLAIPPSKELTPQDIEACLSLVNKKVSDLMLSERSQEELEHEVVEGTLTLGNQTYSVSDGERLNLMVGQSGSDWIVQWGMYGNEQEIIIGKGKSYQDGNLWIREFDEEFIVTPNTMSAAAAVIVSKTIFIRLKALEMIFYLKWVNGFAYKEWLRDGLDRGIGQAIQSRVFDMYLIRNNADLERVKPQFLADLKEIVLHHEKGHAITQYQFLPLEIATLAEATTVFGESIMSSILEVLADLAFDENGYGGPIQVMDSISKIDAERAERMWWMYVSDTWFFNTENDFMYTYSEMICTLMLFISDSDGHLDFSKTKLVLDYRKNLRLDLITGLNELAQRTKSLPHYTNWLLKCAPKKEDEDEYQASVRVWVEIFQKAKAIPEYEAWVTDFLNKEKTRVLTKIFRSFVPDPSNESFQSQLFNIAKSHNL